MKYFLINGIIYCRDITKHIAIGHSETMLRSLSVLVILMLATSIHAFSRTALFSRSTILRMSSSVPTNEEGWRTKLNPNQFAVLRKAATEPAGFSENTPGELEYELKKNAGLKSLNNSCSARSTFPRIPHHFPPFYAGGKYPKSGVFKCVGCDAPLYTASSKFDSGKKKSISCNRLT